MENQNENLEFEISIDFKPGTGDASRVFLAMSGLVNSIQNLDSHLLNVLDNSIETQLVLNDVESGSIKATFRNLLKGIPDQQLKEGKWNEVIGHFLFETKYIVLEWLKDQEEINDIRDIKQLESKIQEKAEQTDIKHLPAYVPPRSEVLLVDIKNVHDSLNRLEDGESITYRNGEKLIKLDSGIEISQDVILDVLTKEVISSTSERILKVKKPDYLGKSKWVMQYEGHLIDVKITDAGWLINFQDRNINVMPGDSLRVILHEEISYGYENEVVDKKFEVEKVIEIIKPIVYKQGYLRL